MQINEVSVLKSGRYIPLKYSYDSLKLRITLDKSYSGGEEYTVFTDYIAKPNEIKALENQTFLDGGGLYFINPTGQDKNMLHIQSFHNHIT